MFQRLPENLIFDILVYFLPECNLTNQKPHFSGFPWYLGHICSRWRFIFLSSRKFWSTFSINLEALEPTARERSLYRAETIINICTERSRQYPITFEFVSLFGAPYYHQIPQQEISFRAHILETLVSKSEYWKEARLWLSSRHLKTLYKAKDHLPRLVSLEILVSSVDDNPVPALFADLFINTPCLSRIFVYQFSEWNLNSTSITTIKIRSLAHSMPEKLHQMLQQTKVLEKLELGGPFDPHVRLDHIKPVTLPFLKILRTVHSNAMIFLSFIQAPALEYLWVEPDLSHSRPLAFNARESLQIRAASFFGSIQHLKYMVLNSRCYNEEATVLIQNAPRVDHLCLIISTPDMLQFPCWSSHHFRQISISLFGNQHNMAPLIREITTWNRSNRADAAPRATFSTLEKVSLDFPLEEPLENPDIVNLKKHFEEQDIQLALVHGPVPRPYADMRSRYYLDVFEM